MDLGALLHSLIPSWSSAGILLSYFVYLALAGSILPGKNVAGAVLSDATRLHYRCNGSCFQVNSGCGSECLALSFQLSVIVLLFFTINAEEVSLVPLQMYVCFFVITLLLYTLWPNWPNVNNLSQGLASLFILMALLGIGISTRLISPTIIADKGAQLFSVTFIFSVIVTLLLYVVGRKSCDKSSSLRARVTGNFIHDWWFGVQLNPHFMGIDLKFFFVRAGMMGWLFINLSLFSKSFQAGNANLSVILYQLFCALYVIDYFFHEEFMTSTWDVIAENLGFMLVFGDLVFIPFTFSIQGWWLLGNNVKLSKVAALINCLIFLIGYQIFRGANKQKHVFKKDPKAPIWGKPPKVIGGKLLASGYWGISRHCNYLGDLLLALSFSLPCGTSSVIPYFYPIYLLILLIWRERRDDSRCSEKYKEIWAEYCKHVPWRILPYVY